MLQHLANANERSYWFRLWLGTVRQQAHTPVNVDPDLCRHMESLISNSPYQDLTQTATFVIKILQVIHTPLYSAVSVCSSELRLSYAPVRPLIVCIIKPGLIMNAKARCKHTDRLFPSPSWFLVTNFFVQQIFVPVSCLWRKSLSISGDKPFRAGMNNQIIL